MPRVREHDDRREAGQRLKKALDGYFPRSRGGLRALADAAKIGPETLYRWFRGDSDPDLGTLSRVATACGVTRTELVAAMDGQTTQEDAVQPTWAQALITRDELSTIIDRAKDEVLSAIAVQREALYAQLAERLVADVMRQLQPPDERPDETQDQPPGSAAPPRA